MENQHCKYCGTEFFAEPKEISRGNAIFCSLSCASKYGNTVKQVYEHTCIFCNTSFKSTAPNAKYCSDKCKLKHYRALQKIVNGLTRKQTEDLAKLPCANCGWDLGPRDVHHIKLVSKGGKATSENMITLCPNCHRLAHRNLLSEDKLLQLVEFRTISSSSKTEETDALTGN